jgi:hypothetical protein
VGGCSGSFEEYTGGIWLFEGSRKKGKLLKTTGLPRERRETLMNDQLLETSKRPIIDLVVDSMMSKEQFEREKWEELPLDARQYVEEIEAGRVPKFSPGIPGFDFRLGYFYARTRCINRGCWAIVDQQWTKQLADWIGTRTVLEVMAGGGWIAKALKDHGVDIVATDDYSWPKGGNGHSNLPTWDDLPVTKMGALKAVRTIPADILLVSWPPYSDTAIVRICNTWGTTRPIIHIGEGQGGCTACDKFYERFKEDEEAPIIMLGQWPGIHDHLTIGYWTR